VSLPNIPSGRFHGHFGPPIHGLQPESYSREVEIERANSKLIGDRFQRGPSEAETAAPISRRPVLAQRSGRLTPVSVMQSPEDGLADHGPLIPSLDRPPLRRVLVQPEVRP
jgi:hypothetical protein